MYDYQPPVLEITMEPDMGMFPDETATVISSEITLAEVYQRPDLKDVVDIRYEYDMGDGWDHSIALVGRSNPLVHNLQIGAPGEAKILCIAGEGHACAEDCGGGMGWEVLKEAFEKPRNRELAERREWYKKYCMNGDGKALKRYAFEVADVNDALRKADLAYG